METGRLVQLTDDPAIQSRTACPDHTEARRLYYLRGPEVFALDVIDYTARRIGEIPKPHVGGFQQPTLSADAKWLTLTKQRDESNWEIGLMSTETGVYRSVITQGFRIGHAQHSPRIRSFFMFGKRADTRRNGPGWSMTMAPATALFTHGLIRRPGSRR